MSECPTNNMHVTCDTCDYAFSGKDNINFVLSSNDERDMGIKYFCSVNCLLDYVEMQYQNGQSGGKKLKPVDENCLYKPVICLGDQVIYMGRGALSFPTYFDVKKHELRCTSSDFMDRIPDYEYGDGGNYE